jgi:hypothetical protein
MMEEGIIKLTNALYKVTSLFPKEEPLKFAIRKEGLDILFYSLLMKGRSFSVLQKEKDSFSEKASGKIDLLKTYFGIAREQEWINERNFDILENEYEELRKSFEIIRPKESIKKPVISERPIEIKKEVEEVVEKVTKKEEVALERVEPKSETKEIKHINYEDLTSIQLRVLEILQNKGILKSNQISEHFPTTNPRTIRRELKGLKEMKIINSIGGGKTTVYKINEMY